jgi:hypothetical protein
VPLGKVVSLSENSWVQPYYSNTFAKYDGAMMAEAPSAVLRAHCMARLAGRSLFV